jgi:hypothetical protein
LHCAVILNPNIHLEEEEEDALTRARRGVSPGRSSQCHGRESGVGFRPISQARINLSIRHLYGVPAIITRHLGLKKQNKTHTHTHKRKKTKVSTQTSRFWWCLSSHSKGTTIDRFHASDEAFESHTTWHRSIDRSIELIAEPIWVAMNGCRTLQLLRSIDRSN